MNSIGFSSGDAAEFLDRPADEGRGTDRAWRIRVRGKRYSRSGPGNRSNNKPVDAATRPWVSKDRIRGLASRNDDAYRLIRRLYRGYHQPCTPKYQYPACWG